MINFPIEWSEESQNIREAFFTTHSLLGPLKTDDEADTGKYKYKYATLNRVLDVIEKVTDPLGLLIMQSPCNGPQGEIGVATLVLHKSGEWCRFQYFVPLGKADPQGAGSAITYCRRYALVALFDLAVEDDDGKGATADADKKADAKAATGKANVFDPNQLLMRAVELKKIPSADKVAFKMWAATLKGCESLHESKKNPTGAQWKIIQEALK